MTENWKSELFINNQFEVNSYRVGNVGLGASTSDIDYFDITDVYVDVQGYENMRFKDRIELLNKGKGWVHCASGVSFGIKKGIVKQIKLSGRYLQDNKTDRKSLISSFGIPDAELVDDMSYSEFDYGVDSYVLVYRKRGIYAFLDPRTDKLKELHFGEFNEKFYGKK